MIIDKEVPVETVIITSHRVYDTLGGVEKFVVSFSSWCNNHGVGVTVISRSLSASQARVTYGPVPVQRSGDIRYVKKVKLPFLLYYAGLSSFSLLAFMKSLNAVKRIRLQTRKPIILHSQDINFAALATVIVGKLLNMTTIIHQHGPYEKLLPSKSMRIIEQSINKITCKLSDLIIATDKYTQEYLMTIGVDSKKTVVIPAAVDTEFFNVPADNRLGFNGPFKIGYIGRLSPEKNVETLIRAFKEFKTTKPASSGKLVIVGDGALREPLKRLASELGIADAVEFTGFKTDIKPILSTLDIFVLPSRVEGTPISLIEALSAGKAIIASNIPPIREIVEAEEDALLFEVDNYFQLKEKMVTLFENSQLRQELGKNAKNRSKQYDTEIVYSKIFQCYRMLQKKSHLDASFSNS